MGYSTCGCHRPPQKEAVPHDGYRLCKKRAYAKNTTSVDRPKHLSLSSPPTPGGENSDARLFGDLKMIIVHYQANATRAYALLSEGTIRP